MCASLKYFKIHTLTSLPTVCPLICEECRNCLHVYSILSASCHVRRIFPWRPTFLTSELLGSVVQVMMRETARRVSLEFTKSVGSICRARDSMYFKMVTLTCEEDGQILFTDDLDQRRWSVVLRNSSYLQIWCLSLINDKPHENVELLVKRERLPVKQGKYMVDRKNFSY